MPAKILEQIGGLVKGDPRFHRKVAEESLYKQFIAEFPLDKLPALSLDEYCLGSGRREDCFSWWLERGLEPLLGRYSPGNSTGHVMYLMKDRNYYKHSRLSDLSDEQAMRYVATIHHTIASATPDDYLWLDERDEIYRRANVEPRATMGAGRLMRLVLMYNPDGFPAISSLDHIRHFLTVFGETEIPRTPAACVSRLLSHYETVQSEYEPLLTLSGFTSALYSDELGIQPAARQQKSSTPVDESENDEQLTGTSASARAKNQILYGPPGTGKTFDTRRRAVSLADPEWYRELIEQDLEDTEFRIGIVDKYAALEEQHRIVFVTIHQSVSYEDFIEGIRATSSDGVVSYGIEDGVFKKIAQSAGASVTVGAVTAQDSSIDLTSRRVWKMSLGNTQRDDDDIFNECIERSYIAHGYGRSMDFSDCDDLAQITDLFNGHDPALLEQSNFPAKLINLFKNRMAVSDLVVVTDGNKKFRAIGEVTGEYEFLSDDPLERFHQARKVRWLRIFEQSVPREVLFRKAISQMTFYELKPDTLNLDKLAEFIGVAPDLRETPQYVMIMDEINRGNISRIFGELITLLEPDKRLNQDDERKVVLPYSKEPFALPDNLHVIGTMNTADKSLAQLDLALRRRFEFIEMMPEPELLSGVSVFGVELSDLLTTLNARIEVLLDRDHQIGHAYFWPVLVAADTEARRTRLAQVFRLKIIPLLQEYFYADWDQIRWVLNDIAKSPQNQFVTRITKPSIDTLFDESVASQINDRRYCINERAFQEAEAYQKIMNRPGAADADS